MEQCEQQIVLYTIDEDIFTPVPNDQLVDLNKRGKSTYQLIEETPISDFQAQNSCMTVTTEAQPSNMQPGKGLRAM